jgi:hypothetical protein
MVLQLSCNLDSHNHVVEPSIEKREIQSIDQTGILCNQMVDFLVTASHQHSKTLSARGRQKAPPAVNSQTTASEPAVSRLRIHQNTNGFGVRFRARLSEGHTPRFDLTRA